MHGLRFVVASLILMSQFAAADVHRSFGLAKGEQQTHFFELAGSRDLRVVNPDGPVRIVQAPRGEKLLKISVKRGRNRPVFELKAQDPKDYPVVQIQGSQDGAVVNVQYSQNARGVPSRQTRPTMIIGTFFGTKVILNPSIINENTVTVEVSVPEHLLGNVFAQSSFSNVEMTGAFVRGAEYRRVILLSEYGAVLAKDVVAGRGIVLRSQVGEAVAARTYGELFADTITGHILAQATAAARGYLRSVTGAITVTSATGDIVTHSDGGAVTLASSAGNLYVSGSGIPVTIANQSSDRMWIMNGGGPISVANSRFKDQRLLRIDGKCRHNLEGWPSFPDIDAIISGRR